MMPDQRAAYIESHPEVMTMSLPDGWRRLNCMPLCHKVEFLLTSGLTYVAGASNPAFLVNPDHHVAWRPLPMEAALELELPPGLRSRLPQDVVDHELARLTAKYARLG
jgi:hypothetical protein